MKAGRIILGVILLLLAGLVGVGIYYQMRTARLFRDAMAVARDYPQQAYLRLKPVRDFGDTRTFGEASRAMNHMVMEIYGNSVSRLMKAPDDPGAYLYGLNTLGVLRTLKDDGYAGLDQKIASILKAARDSVDRVAAEGAHGTWQEMRNFFKALEQREFEIPPEIIEDFDAWMVHLDDRNADEGPVIYLRDIRKQIARGNKQSREVLGFDAANIVAGTVLPLPESLPEVVNLNLDEQLRVHLDQIGIYERDYERESTGTLDLTKGFLLYNRAAVMAAHLLDRGMVARRMGSSFIAQRMLVNSPTEAMRYIPPPDELVDSFQRQALEYLKEAEEAILGSPVSPEEGAGLIALRYRLERDLLSEGSEARADAEFLLEEWLALTNETFREALQSAPGRVLFLLRIPSQLPEETS